MVVRIWSNVAALAAVVLAQGALAQGRPFELTPAGKGILQARIAVDGRPLHDRPGPTQPLTFPLAMCAFPGGLCGAVNRNGTTAVMPRYDWVGTFSDGRAAVRLGVSTASSTKKDARKRSICSSSNGNSSISRSWDVWAAVHGG